MIKKILKPIISRPFIAKWIVKTLIRTHIQLGEWVNEIIVFSENGVHPKHRLMNYHQFFLDHINIGDKVLDVGCGRGIVSFDLAGKAGEVLGIDMNAQNIEWAKRHYQRVNLTFVCGDATKDLDGATQYDVIVLSNVLEHIEDRVAFLKNISKMGKKVLIRVPMIERDWLVFYKKEIGLEYRSDASHFIEYTEKELLQELENSNLAILYRKVAFGEFWVVAKIENIKAA